jgi:hypothetical protein
MGCFGGCGSPVRYKNSDATFIENVSQADGSTLAPSTLALLYFHLHCYFVRKSGRWVDDGSQSEVTHSATNLDHFKAGVPAI